MSSYVNIFNISGIEKSVKNYDKNLKLLVDDDMGITDDSTKEIVGKTIKSIYLSDTEDFESNVGKAIQVIFLFSVKYINNKSYS